MPDDVTGRPVFETDEGDDSVLAPPNVLFARKQLPPDVLFLDDDRVRGRLTFTWRGKKYWYVRVERMLHGVRIKAYKLVLEEERK